jgi:uncharacterized protein DUF5317
VLLVVLALACVAAVPLTGRRLDGLLDLHLRWSAAAFAAIAIQIAITELDPGGRPALHAGLHMATYVLAAAFLVVNRSVPGLWLVALGGASNFAAIVANGGVMPAAPGALAIAGVPEGTGFDNSASLAHPHLLALGDVIPVAAPWGLGNVLSAGDLILFAGAICVLFSACGHRNAQGTSLQTDHQ